MKPVAFTEANAVLHGAPGSDIGPLPVFANGDQTISCWELSAEDLATLFEGGGRVWLAVLGSQMPPVWLTTARPFVSEGASR